MNADDSYSEGEMVPSNSPILGNGGDHQTPGLMVREMKTPVRRAVC